MASDLPLITADPGYEAAAAGASVLGARTIRIPLTKTFAHDVRAMAAASRTAGVIDICNPNHPTGSITPRADIEWLLANKPAGSIVLLDEAYIHISTEPACSDLVAQNKDLVILRTFSKLYGMAGLRAGAALARPDLLDKMGQFDRGALPITGMAAATASLNAPGLVEQRRKIIADIREDTIAFLKQHGYTVVPSLSNKFMVDAKRPATEVAALLRAEKVYIGRPWPVWPNHCRITVGTREEMEIFKKAFLKVMA